MPTRVYATAEQVALLVGIEGATEVSLRRASRDVDTILRGASYEHTEDGMPTDPVVVELLAEMVAEQIAWYDELGDETGIVGAGGGSIGSVTLPKVTTSANGSAGSSVFAPRAVQLARTNLDFRVGY